MNRLAPFGTPEYRARFFSKTKRAENGCLEWMGWREKTGHGKVWRDGAMRSTSRTVWEMECGTIPNGMCVLHDCDNACCVDINHLHLGTWDDNNKEREMRGRGRQPRGEYQTHAILKEPQVLEIWNLRGHKTIHQIGAQFGVDYTTISKIHTGKNWGWLTQKQNEIH